MGPSNDGLEAEVEADGVHDGAHDDVPGAVGDVAHVDAHVAVAAAARTVPVHAEGAAVAVAAERPGR